MNKYKKILIVSLIIISIFIISFLIFNLGILQSLLFQSAQADCSNSGIDTWTCSTSNYGSPVIPNIPGQKFTLNLKQVTSTSHAFLFSQLCVKMNDLAGITCDSGIPELANFGSGLPSSTKYAWEGEYFINSMGKQLITIDAVYHSVFGSPDYGTPDLNFKFYGLCYAGQTCELITPQGVENLPSWDAKVNPSSIIITFKKGGYTEEDLSNLIKINKLSTLSNFYTLKNNNCNLTSKYLTQQTSDDYLTLNECENKIIYTKIELINILTTNNSIIVISKNENITTTILTNETTITTITVADNGKIKVIFENAKINNKITEKLIIWILGVIVGIVIIIFSAILVKKNKKKHKHR